jgi:hypothetical protein
VTTEQQEISNDNEENELNEKVDDEKSSTESDSVASTAFSDDLVKDEGEEFQNLVDEVTVDEKIETISNEKVTIEEDENPQVPDSLLNAVGDLLSSVLGISLSDLKDDDDEEQQQQITDENDLHSHTTTEGDINEHEEEVSEQQSAAAVVEDTVTSNNVVDDDTAEAVAAGADSDDHNPTSEKAPVVNEVDLKIENLANVQTSFVTENTPENYVDNTVKEQTESSDDTSETDDDKIVLETLSELSTIADDDLRGGEEEEEVRKPVSFEDSVKHVMNLVRGTEGNLALEAAQNIVDSVLIDSHMDDSVSDLDQIVYGTLKEIESNLGLNEGNKNLPADSFDLNEREHEREEMIKSFETDINESLRRINPDDEDYESLEIEPNPAKAAMYYKFQYGDDF